MGWRTAIRVGLVAAALAGAGCGVEQDGELGAGRAFPSTAASGDDRDEPEVDLTDVLDGEAARNALEQARELGLGSDPADFADGELECIGRAVLDGEVDLEASISDPGADEEREALFDVVLGCVDDPTTNESIVHALTTNFAAGAGIDDLTDAEGSCLLAYLLAESDDPARVLMGAPDLDDVELVLAGAEDCFTEEHYGILSGAPGTGPQAYGDDAGFDALQDECEGGDDRACDLLYLSSSSESAYESVGETCAGRNPSGDEFCSAEAEWDDDGFAPEDSAGLPVLAADCEGGDLTACDLLYQLARPGSPFEAVGHTCGGQIPVGALPDCRTSLGS